MAGQVPPSDPQGAAAQPLPQPPANQPPPGAVHRRPRTKEDVMRFGCVATVRTFDKKDAELSKVSRAWRSVRNAFRSWRDKPPLEQPTREQITHQSPWSSQASKSVNVQPGNYESIRTRFLLNEGIYADENSRYIIDSTAGRVFLETEENGVKKYESFSIINPKTGEPMQKTEKLIRAAKLIIATKKDEKAGNCFDQGDLVVFHVSTINEQENLEIRLFNYQAWEEGIDSKLRDDFEDYWSEQRTVAYKKAYNTHVGQNDDADTPSLGELGFNPEAHKAGIEAKRKIDEQKENELMIHKVRRWDPKASLFGKDGSVEINPADRLYGKEVKFSDNLKGELARILRLKDDGKLRDDKTTGRGGGAAGAAAPASAAAQQLAQQMQQMQQAGAAGGAGPQDQNDLAREVQQLRSLLGRQDALNRENEERANEQIKALQAQLNSLQAQKGQGGAQSSQINREALEEQVRTAQQREQQLQFELQQAQERERMERIEALRVSDDLRSRLEELEAQLAAARAGGGPMEAADVEEVAAVAAEPIGVPEGFEVFELPPHTEDERFCAIFAAQDMLTRNPNLRGITEENVADFRDRVATKRTTAATLIFNKIDEWFGQGEQPYPYENSPTMQAEMRFYLKTLENKYKEERNRYDGAIKKLDAAIQNMEPSPQREAMQEKLDAMKQRRAQIISLHAKSFLTNFDVNRDNTPIQEFIKSGTLPTPSKLKAIMGLQLTNDYPTFIDRLPRDDQGYPTGFTDDAIVLKVLKDKFERSRAGDDIDLERMEVQIYDAGADNPEFDSKKDGLYILKSGQQYFLLRKIAPQQE